MFERIIFWLAKKIIKKEVKVVRDLWEAGAQRDLNMITTLTKKLKDIEHLKGKYETLLADEGRMFKVTLSMHRDMTLENLFILRDHDDAAYYSIQALLDNCLGKGAWGEGNIITVVMNVVGEDADDAIEKGV